MPSRRPPRPTPHRAPAPTAPVRADRPTPHRPPTDVVGGGDDDPTVSPGSDHDATRRPPSVASDAPAVPWEPRRGDLLRGRFELIARLGQGGMGAVWKGKDRLKEEARDRNPYVAIKLLHSGFRDHPAAFVALQRESSKQQRLAHPNIATVHDFDRDDATGTVFMTMEVLDGQPLDAFLRRLPPGGLAPAEAMVLIEQLAAGLGHAHANGLVHADLKPGNCFLTSDGTIKLLDFGIARASKPLGGGALAGDTTVFDPKEFGALTPSYASLEMLDGEDADPRDDIYALAVITYQLLSGRHPYGRTNAQRAFESGLRPEPIGRLSRRANTALASGLAFRRASRPATVEAFVEGLRAPADRARRVALAAAVTAIVVGLAAWGPIDRFLAERERAAVMAMLDTPGPAALTEGLRLALAIRDPAEQARVLADPRTGAAVARVIAHGDPRSVDAGLAAIRELPAAWQRAVRDQPLVRDAVFAVHRRAIREAFAPESGRLRFRTAAAHLDTLIALYPDSARVMALRDTLATEHEQLLARLTARWRALQADGVGRTLGAEHRELLAALRELDPDHPLLALAPGAAASASTPATPRRTLARGDRRASAEYP